MKVLMLNGSMKPRGNTALALEEIGRQLEAEGIEYEIFQLAGDPLRDCIGCGQCTDEGCVFGGDDGVNAFIAKAREADGFVFGSPVYYAHPSGRILSFLDRVFYSSSAVFAHKPAAAVAVARRGGATASFDVLNKYFGISEMPVAGSSYWNIAHGRRPGESPMDAEGMRTMRNLARNMAWMLKCFEAGKKAGIPLPERETGPATDFIR
jgi:Multimeric flavodoxin WrbA